MQESTASDSERCRRPRKASLTILLALFALTAGAQAFAPVQAAALISEGSGPVCTPDPDDPTKAYITVGDNKLPCETVNVTDTASPGTAGLPSMNGPRTPTGTDRNFGGGPGPRPGSGSLTKASRKDRVKAKLRAGPLIDPKDGNHLACMMLRGAFLYDRPITDVTSQGFVVFVPTSFGEVHTRYFGEVPRQGWWWTVPLYWRVAVRKMTRLPDLDLTEDEITQLRKLQRQLADEHDPEKLAKIWQQIADSAPDFSAKQLALTPWDEEWEAGKCAGKAPWHDTAA
jgi:hypothetical protein